jgi:hypothetical protein
MWYNVKDLKTKNYVILTKWLFKLLNEEVVWLTLLRKIKLGSKVISQLHLKPGGSHFSARSFFVAMDLSSLETELRFSSRRIHDFQMPLFGIIISLWTIIHVTKAVQLQRCWNFPTKYALYTRACWCAACIMEIPTAAVAIGVTHEYDEFPIIFMRMVIFYTLCTKH